MTADPKLSDRVEKLGKSLIQHGPANDRIYLLKLDSEDLPELVEQLDQLAKQQGYSKIFIKIPQPAQAAFEQAGYQIEAQVPGLFQGAEEGLFMARYLAKERHQDVNREQVETVIKTALNKAEGHHQACLPDGCHYRLATAEDCPQMARLYQQTFASYPFPIDNVDFLLETMADSVLYAGIWQGDQLLALASADIDYQQGNAEMTDFATDSAWRGKGLANLLLQSLEETLKPQQIKTLYTIARATSYGMNICFAQNGYQFGGTLINNTQIAGQLESMNVWHKRLAQ